MPRPLHRDDGMHATHEVARQLGVGYRRLHRLVQAGHITPTVPPTGSGSSTRWTDDDVAEARRILERIDWGMTPEAAARTTDPPLPGSDVLALREVAREGGTEDIPSIDVCAFCWDSECDGIGCIASLDPDDLNHHPAIELHQELLRAGRALIAATDGEVA